MVTCLSSRTQPETAIDFADFLKTSFLSETNQYFIFSSTVASVACQLCVYLDTFNERSIATIVLPLLRNVFDGVKIFNWTEMSERQEFSSLGAITDFHG